MDNGILTHGNPSAFIAAMCHTKTCNRASFEVTVSDIETEDIATKPVIWNGMRYSETVCHETRHVNGGPVDSVVGHCSFSAAAVGWPVPGHHDTMTDSCVPVNRLQTKHSSHQSTNLPCFRSALFKICGSHGDRKLPEAQKAFFHMSSCVASFCNNDVIADHAALVCRKSIP